MDPIYCDECGRANGRAARKCIWCGVPIAGDVAGGRLDATRVEIGYLDGIDRLEGAGPVSLVVSALGIEVTELIPGSRAVRIPIGSILEAGVVDASRLAEGKRIRAGWRRLAVGPFASLASGKQTSDLREHDYVLTITYTAGEEVRTAMFHRQDEAGLAVVEGLARTVNALARRK